MVSDHIHYWAGLFTARKGPASPTEWEAASVLLPARTFGGTENFLPPAGSPTTILHPYSPQPIKIATIRTAISRLPRRTGRGRIYMLLFLIGTSRPISNICVLDRSGATVRTPTADSKVF